VTYRRSYLKFLFVAGLLVLATAALAQRRGGGGGFGGGFGGGIGGRPQSSRPDVTFPDNGEFHYLRMEYNDFSGNRGFNGSRRGQANGWWAQDWPDAENHFSFALQRLTNITVGKPEHVGLIAKNGGDEIFEYPWIYVTQAGNWVISDEEVMKFREFFSRGGFMMTDDTWGPNEQAQFADVMTRVFPDRQMVDISENDSIVNVMYTIQDKDRTYIPGSRHLDRSGGIRDVGAQPRWMAIHDEKNRVVVAVDYDTDIGDAWEFADDPRYPEQMTTLAYHYGINYLVYAMTH